MAELKMKQLGVGRRQLDDLLFVDGDNFCRMFVREGIIDIDDEQLCHKVIPMFPCEAPGCKETFESIMGFEMHYNSRHRFLCRECRKALPTAHLLDLHISETHDSFFAVQAERKPMYRCFVEECLIVSQDISQRRKHCIEAHNFPHDFRYDQSLKKIKNPKPHKFVSSKTVVEEMIVDECQEEEPQKFKPISFGRGKQGKKFFNIKPWHTKGKKVSENESRNDENKDLSTSELMDALPSGTGKS